MIEIDFKHSTKCPVCKYKLVVIDNYNYITMICPKCHSTVFEEFNHVVHIVKNGIMEDGYDVSLDIFYKQLLTHAMYANTLQRDDFEEYWNRIKWIGVIGNEDILSDGIYDYFINKIENFKMKQPCIYFNGYEKYLEASKSEAEKFQEMYLKKKVGE